MTDKELYDYFWQILLDGTATKEQTTAMFNARQLWHQLQDNVYEKYGEEIVAPSHVCDTLNPFTIHFTWDYKDGNTLGCSINEKSEASVCFNNDSYSWKEYVTLPDIEMSERLMYVFYSYYLKKNNGH